MRLLVVLSNEVKPFGKVLNAIGHMMVGLAPRFPKGKFPKIEIFSSSSQQVREFRRKAYNLHAASQHDTAFSDFPHTTTEGSARDHASNTHAIKESDISYYASCICGSSESLSTLDQLLPSDSKLVTSDELDSVTSEFTLEAPLLYPDQPTFVEDDRAKKFSIVLSNKLPGVPDTLLELIRTCIALGNHVENPDLLKLHQYPDADGEMHPGMSEYGLVALKAKNPTKLQEIATGAGQQSLDSKFECKSHDLLTAVGLFGKRETLEGITNKKVDLWKGELPTPPTLTSQYDATKESAVSALEKPAVVKLAADFTEKLKL